MKKFLALTCALILVLSLVGCNRQATTETPTEPIPAVSAVPNEWGLVLETENVTESGLTILCHHTGGEDVMELQTGSYYVIQKPDATGWIDVEYLPHDFEIAWTMEAWMIQQESTTTWDVNWEFLYGKLPAGKYRIGKEIMNFRGPGDYDKCMLYAEFTIQ